MPAIESSVSINKTSHKRDDDKPNIDSTSSVEKPFSEHLQQEIDKEKESVTAIDEASGNKKEEYVDDEVAIKPLINSHNDGSLEDNISLLSGNELPAQEVLTGKLPVEPMSHKALNLTALASQENALKKVPTPSIKSEELLTVSNQVLEADSEVTEVSTDKIKLSKDNVEFTKVEITVNDTAQSQKNIQSVALNTSSLNETAKNPPDNASLSTQLSTPINSKKWGSELAQKINVIIESGQKQVAELRLNPAHLGPLSIRLNLDEDQASLSFLTNHHAVKEAIEASIPRLREQLQQQGLDLTSVDVEKRNQSQDSSEGDFSQSNKHSESEFDDDAMQPQELKMPINVNAGLSVFV